MYDHDYAFDAHRCDSLSNSSVDIHSSEMHGSASLSCLCSHVVPQCSFNLLVWLMQNGNLKKKSYFWIIRISLKESSWLTSGNCGGSGSFLVSFSVHHSVHSLCSTLLLVLSFPSSYLSNDGIVFHVLACMFICMCACINMHVETNRESWLWSSGTLSTSFETGSSLAWSSSNRLSKQRTPGVPLALGFPVHPNMSTIFTCILGINADPHDCKASTLLTEPFP